ncbi:TIM barrel protein [Candidatus Omnitrophota bacterium]
MEKLLFGTGGIPHSAGAKTTVSGIERIAELGLGCMEIEFVQGVRMKEASALLVAETATRDGVKLSAHAPYFINLNAHEPEKIKASQDRLLQAARISAICGAESVAFHPAYYLGDPPEKTYNTVKKYLEETLNQLRQEEIRVWIRPEVMGKHSGFGTLEEILNLCTELEKLGICVDFAHWHARTEKFNSYQEFGSMLAMIKERLGRDALDNMHIHVSGIAYGKKGEIKHINLKESDFQYTELLKALIDCNARGLVICESPNLEEDALLLQATHHTLLKAG